MDRVLAAQVPPGPWLDAGFASARPPRLRAATACLVVTASLRALGWAVDPWPDSRVLWWSARTSTTFHVLRAICLRTTFTGMTPQDAALVAHEEVHVRQAGRRRVDLAHRNPAFDHAVAAAHGPVVEVETRAGWWAMLWWTVRYLACRGFRLAAELEAEAHEAAMLARLGERDADLRHQLGSWRCPRVDGWTVDAMVEHVRVRSLALRGEA